MSTANTKSVTIPAWVLNEVLQLAKPRAQAMGKALDTSVVVTPEQIPPELVAVGAAVAALAGKDTSRPKEMA